ncbi:MAG TPA: division plane positioning ATPase MipZ [Pseudonocardiaceae bacterium]|nr:division plane positioning ATPase MipZ [Pseudonocardiaceae bacterium]
MTILCEPNPVRAARVAAYIDGVVWTVENLAGAAQALDDNVDESVVVLGSGTNMAQALGFTSLLHQVRPTAAVILLREPGDESGYFVHSGLFETVTMDGLDELADACRRATHPSGPPRAGHVVTVFAPMSGYGKTTVATNLAAVLAARSWRVCLVDLDLAHGDMAVVLGFWPDRMGPLDSPTVTRLRAGLDCVLAPVRPAEPERLPPDAVDALLAALAARYDYVVVDTPAQFTTHVLDALDRSDHHVLVATPERPALRNLRRTLDILDLLGHPREARTVLLNRCDQRGELSAEDVEALIRNPVAGRLPGTADVPASINNGVPLAISAPDHPFTEALRRFAGAHVPSGDQTVRGGGPGAR